MKKTKSIAAACALSAALALGAAPLAFAADNALDKETSTENGVAKGEDGATTGNTTVNVATVASNISATIPLSVQVAGPAEGGDLTVPTNYGITNNSVYPIKVSEVKADMTGMTDWALATAKQDGTSEITGKVGNIYLTLKPAKGTLWTASETVNKPTDWIVAAKSGDKGTTENIALAGSISGVKTVSDKATAALKVVYTITATADTSASA